MEISISSRTTTNHVFPATGNYQQTGLISKMISSIIKCISSVTDDIKIIIWQLGCFALAPGSNTHINMNWCWIRQESHDYFVRGAKNIWHLYHKNYFYTYSELLGLLLFKKHPTNSLWLIVLVLLMKECKKIAYFQIF